ncbi:MAG: right-handed parallel beta-helix repeat-containing protein [Myxococcales bacterium]|nr:right-handed parallel beta-helix repeat-containing protein [Myxococcales bacterium]
MKLVVSVFAACALIASTADATEYFVNIGRGKGKDGTKEKPAKDLGNLVAKLVDGDVVNIAEGSYLGRDDSGTDELAVSVSIIGGWNDDFTKRDPWGAHRTVMSGTNAYGKSGKYRLIINAQKCAAPVVVDGLIFDNGPRNAYKDEAQTFINRMANGGKNINATPESGGLSIKLGKSCEAVVKNNVVMNTAPTGAALGVWGNEKSKARIENNLVINNTGEGIWAYSLWKAKDGLPEFVIERNTVLFTWKHDAIATYGGNSLKMDTEVKLTATNNVFAFGDYGGVDNIKVAKGITLKDNLFTGHRLYDYREFNTSVKVDEFEDEADQLVGSTGNVSKAITVPMNEKWATLYAGRKEISRAAVDAKAKASNNGANALRGMLGLPLQANAVGLDAEVWLHRMSVDDAVKAGFEPYDGFGCKKP